MKKQETAMVNSVKRIFKNMVIYKKITFIEYLKIHKYIKEFYIKNNYDYLKKFLKNRNFKEEIDELEFLYKLYYTKY